MVGEGDILANFFLPDGLVNKLLDTYKTPEAVSVVLSGSFARGDYATYSDIDLIFYMTDASACVPDYELHYHDDLLVSISRTMIAKKREEMGLPQAAIWVVEGLRQSKILYDPSGEFATLQREAFDFVWESLQSQANQYASENLRGLIEEAHKILSGFQLKNDAMLYIAALGMIISLPRIIAVQRGLLMVTENQYVDRVQESVGINSEWTRIYRIAAGIDHPLKVVQNLVRTRALAALKLFELTVNLLRDQLQSIDLTMIDQVLRIIAEARYPHREI